MCSSDLLPSARLQREVTARQDGFVVGVDAMEVALAALRLGAGRARAEDRVDPAVGVSQLVKVGERVTAGQVLAVIHANDESALAAAVGQVSAAVALAAEPPPSSPLIAEVIG